MSRGLKSLNENAWRVNSNTQKEKRRFEMLCVILKPESAAWILF